MTSKESHASSPQPEFYLVIHYDGDQSRFGLHDADANGFGYHTKQEFVDFIRSEFWDYDSIGRSSDITITLKRRKK